MDDNKTVLEVLKEWCDLYKPENSFESLFNEYERMYPENSVLDYEMDENKVSIQMDGLSLTIGLKINNRTEEK